MSILSVFILCSLSYQPIIADTPIETIGQVKESKASNLDVDEIKELYNKIIELKSQSNDDCGCKDTEDISYPIICNILFLLFLLLLAPSYLFNLIAMFGWMIGFELWYYFWFYIATFSLFPAVILSIIYFELGCVPDFIPWP